MASGGAYNYEWDPIDPVIENVNPAYIIPFDFIPTNSVSIGTVTGSVFCTTSGGNNQLESGSILIEWRYEDSAIWQTGTSALVDDGNFEFIAGVLELTNIYVRARVKDIKTPRAGFPFSSEVSVTVVPEPGTLILFSMLFITIAFRKK